MPKLPKNLKNKIVSVDLVVTSPPYNIGKSYESRKKLDVYLEEQANVIAECHRVLSPSGSSFPAIGSFGGSSRTESRPTGPSFRSKSRPSGE